MKSVFIMCPGVGHIGRGYESFSNELFHYLRHEKDVHVTLIKGAGRAEQDEHVAFCIKRTTKWAYWLGSLFKQPPYHIEQFTFFISSLPTLLFRKPDVIVYSDFYLGVLLWYLRKLLHLRYILLFSNGAPNGPPFTRCDFVQQLLPFYKDIAVNAGEDPLRHIVLPYAIEVPTLPLPTQEEKKKQKKALSIDQEFLILCVAAINDSHKRISYLIDEIVALQNPNICLVVLGQKNEESDAIIQKGERELGTRFQAKTVGKEALANYYIAADLFVLPSLTEGLPRVMLEALSYGLPVLSHDYEVSRNVLQEFGHFADFRNRGAIGGLVAILLKEQTTKDDKIAYTLRNYVQKYYSWASLGPKYKEMIMRITKER